MTRSTLAWLVFFKKDLIMELFNVSDTQEAILPLRNLIFIKAVAQRCSVKKMFVKMSQNSQENTCVSLFFNEALVTFTEEPLMENENFFAVNDN